MPHTDQHFQRGSFTISFCLNLDVTTTLQTGSPISRVDDSALWANPITARLAHTPLAIWVHLLQLFYAIDIQSELILLLLGQHSQSPTHFLVPLLPHKASDTFCGRIQIVRSYQLAILVHVLISNVRMPESPTTRISLHTTSPTNASHHTPCLMVGSIQANQASSCSSYSSSPSHSFCLDLNHSSAISAIHS